MKDRKVRIALEIAQLRTGTPKVDAIACIHAEKIAIYGLPLCHRANDNGSVSFIEWAKNCPQR